MIFSNSKHAYWQVMGNNIYHQASSPISFMNGYFDVELVETLIVLILKEERSTSFKHFFPISLCNVIYKLITKVSVNMLRPRLDELIGLF
jgi:hypothetical protein